MCIRDSLSLVSAAGHLHARILARAELRWEGRGCMGGGVRGEERAHGGCCQHTARGGPAQRRASNKGERGGGKRR
eukprot:1624412-Rhodomonas_salina.1